MPAIKLVLTDEELADIDRVSGTTPRERWIKDLCRAAVDAVSQLDAEPGGWWLRIKATPREGTQPEGVHHFVPVDE